MLTVDRLADLSLETRADIVWGLQRGRTPRTFETAIRSVFTASTGEELRQLRNMINWSGNHYDLSRLIFEDIDSDDIRQDILAHIKEHQVPTDELKVLSDIDDTVFARLHDKRYPGKTRYPGVLALFNALDRAPDGEGEQGDLAFVTARPGLFGGLVAAFTRRSLRKAGVKKHNILLGSLLALRSHSHMAKRKVRSIHRYHQIFPEYKLVFVGDSGQGDVQVGRTIKEDLGDAVRGIFIHDVTEVPLETSDAHAQEGIVYFDTYIAAAGEVWRAGIISAAQAISVGNAAIYDLESLVAITPSLREERLAEHMRDLATLRKMIAEEGTVKS